MTQINRHLIFWLSFLFVTLQQGRATDGFQAGPLYDSFALTLAEGHRTEVVGPFFYSQLRETQRTWAIPPLLSRTWDPTTDFNEVDFLFPVITYRRFGGDYRWQMTQMWSFSGGQNQQETTSRRITLFPIYFQQRSADSNQNYTALFPLYGHLKNRLFRDEIFFVLFPIYGQSRKRDVVTDNFLYPLLAWRHGDGLEGWKAWPLLGHEHKDATTYTNSFGEIEIAGGHDNRFALWPLFNLWKSGIGTENPQKELALLPFYNSQRSPRRDSTTVLWPFFAHVTDREKQYQEWQTPWPLIVFARGEGKTTSRVWPFYSRAQNTNLESGFYLWPLYKYNRTHAEPLDRTRTRILLFLCSHDLEKNTETGQARRRIDFWPLFTHTRDFTGATRFQVLSLLEPFLPTSQSVERDYSPLWSVWRTENNPRTQATSQSLLWNLYRRDTTPRSRKSSLLFGLYQYQSGPEGKRLRLFYIPLVKTRSVPDLQAAGAKLSAACTRDLSFAPTQMK